MGMRRWAGGLALRGVAVVFALPGGTAEERAGSDGSAGSESLSRQAAGVCTRAVLRLHLCQRRGEGKRSMVGSSVVRLVFPRRAVKGSMISRDTHPRIFQVVEHHPRALCVPGDTNVAVGFYRFITHANATLGAIRAALGTRSDICPSPWTIKSTHNWRTIAHGIFVRSLRSG